MYYECVLSGIHLSKNYLHALNSRLQGMPLARREREPSMRGCDLEQTFFRVGFLTGGEQHCRPRSRPGFASGKFT